MSLSQMSFEDLVDVCKDSLHYYYFLHFDKDRCLDYEFETYGEWGMWWTNKKHHYATRDMAEIMADNIDEYFPVGISICPHCLIFHYEGEEACENCGKANESLDDAELINAIDDALDDWLTPNDSDVEEFVSTVVWAEWQDTIADLVGSLKEDIEDLLDKLEYSSGEDLVMAVHLCLSLYHASGHMLTDYSGLDYNDVNDLRENGLVKYFKDDIQELLKEDLE